MDMGLKEPHFKGHWGLFHLVSSGWGTRLTMSKAVLQFPLYAFMVWMKTTLLYYTLLYFTTCYINPHNSAFCALLWKLCFLVNSLANQSYLKISIIYSVIVW